MLRNYTRLWEIILRAVWVTITVDGVYDTWSQWSACSVTCGGGSQWRARVCIGPFHGGAACTGPANETRECSLLACPSRYQRFVETHFVVAMVVVVEGVAKLAE